MSAPLLMRASRWQGADGGGCVRSAGCFTDGSASVAPVFAAAGQGFILCLQGLNFAFNVAITDSLVLLSFFVAWRRELLGAALRLLLRLGGRVVTAGTMGRGLRSGYRRARACSLVGTQGSGNNTMELGSQRMEWWLRHRCAAVASSV